MSGDDFLSLFGIGDSLSEFKYYFSEKQIVVQIQSIGYERTWKLYIEGKFVESIKFHQKVIPSDLWKTVLRGQVEIDGKSKVVEFQLKKFLGKYLWPKLMVGDSEAIFFTDFALEDYKGVRVAVRAFCNSQKMTIKISADIEVIASISHQVSNKIFKEKPKIYRWDLVLSGKFEHTGESVLAKWQHQRKLLGGIRNRLIFEKYKPKQS